MVATNSPTITKTAIALAVVSALVLFSMGILIPKEIQAQNATGAGSTMNTMNKSNMTVNSNSSASVGSKVINATNLDTFSAAGPIAGVILPGSSAAPSAQGANSNMTSMAPNSTPASNMTSSSSATITNATTISSIFPAKSFILSGAWHLKAENGKISFFDARFTKVHLDASNRHTHWIGNFHPANNSTSILLNPDGLATIAGTVDIKLNGAPTWTNVKTVIIIDKLSTITITLDPKDTSNHFVGQSIYGTVNMLKDAHRSDIVAFARP